MQRGWKRRVGVEDSVLFSPPENCLCCSIQQYLQKQVCAQHEREDELVLGEEGPAHIFVQVVLEMVAEVS